MARAKGRRDRIPPTRKPPIPHEPPPKKHPGKGSGEGGTSPGTTTTKDAGVTAGDLTSAATTAVSPEDTAANQSDQELAAFFSTGVGPAMHYDQQAQHAESPPVQSTGAGTQ